MILHQPCTSAGLVGLVLELSLGQVYLWEVRGGRSEICAIVGLWTMSLGSISRFRLPGRRRRRRRRNHDNTRAPFVFIQNTQSQNKPIITQGSGLSLPLLSSSRARPHNLPKRRRHPPAGRAVGFNVRLRAQQERPVQLLAPELLAGLRALRRQREGVIRAVGLR